MKLNIFLRCICVTDVSVGVVRKGEDVEDKGEDRKEE